jgi:hypothetical protein
VTAGEAYGQVGRLLLWLEEHNLAHVLAVPKSQMVITMDLRQRRAHAVIAELAENDWKHPRCGDGAHGQRLYDWATIDIRPWRRPGVALAPRPLITDPDDIAYYLCYRPADTDLVELVHVRSGTATASSPGSSRPQARAGGQALLGIQRAAPRPASGPWPGPG